MATINSQEVKYEQLTKTQKLSIFLIVIGPQAAAEVLARFEDTDVEALCREISSIKILDEEIKERVLEEFSGIIGNSISSITGGSDFAQQALELSIGDYKAASIIDKIAPGGSAVELIKEIGDMKPRQIFNLMKDEQPQTIAFLASHLNLAKAAEVVKMLPQKQREDVVEHIGSMDSAPLEMVARVVQAIKPHLNNKEQYATHQSGGVRMVAEVLNMLDKDISKAVLDSLEDRNAALGAAVRKKMFSFDDLVRLDPSDLQRVMREVEMSDIVLAMKSANMVLQEAIFNAVSKRAADTLREELELLGAVKIKEVDEAQDRVMKVVRKLEEDGEVTLDPGSGSNVLG